MLKCKEVVHVNKQQERLITIFFFVLLLAIAISIILFSPKPSYPSFTIGRNMCGKGIWVKYLASCERGNVDAMVAKAKRAGLTFVIIKTHDGDAVYPFRGRRIEQGNQPRKQWLAKMGLTKQTTAKFHQAGIAVFAWGYCYGRDLNGEIELIKHSLELGCDGYVFDVESQMKGNHLAAERLCSEIAGYLKERGLRKLLAYSSYSNPAGHRGFPYEIFNRYCERTLPQTYWSFGRGGRSPHYVVNRFFSQWLRMQQRWRAQGKPELAIPAVPVGQSHMSTPANEVAEFAHLTRNYHGRAYWLWDTTGPKQWQAIKDSKVREFDPSALEAETSRPIF